MSAQGPRFSAPVLFAPTQRCAIDYGGVTKKQIIGRQRGFGFGKRRQNKRETSFAVKRKSPPQAIRHLQRAGLVFSHHIVHKHIKSKIATQQRGCDFEGRSNGVSARRRLS